MFVILETKVRVGHRPVRNLHGEHMHSRAVCPSAGMVDVIFADVAQPDQTRIVALNAHNFLKNGGHFVISIKVR